MAEGGSSRKALQKGRGTWIYGIKVTKGSTHSFKKSATSRTKRLASRVRLGRLMERRLVIDSKESCRILRGKANRHLVCGVRVYLP